mmetsp:Transcript_117447/g.284938  ORF Transcript_117447/g.284938 Transcript_117447/m.284938 type:complete len:282 (-) Transcript_117447:113-958(-)
MKLHLRPLASVDVVQALRRALGGEDRVDALGQGEQHVRLHAQAGHPPQPGLRVRHVAGLGAGADCYVDADGVGLAGAGLDQLRQAALGASRVAGLGVRVDQGSVAHGRQGQPGLLHLPRHSLRSREVSALRPRLQLAGVLVGQWVRRLVLPGVGERLRDLPLGLRRSALVGAKSTALFGPWGAGRASAGTALALGPSGVHHQRKNEGASNGFLQQSCAAPPVQVLHFRECLQQIGLIVSLSKVVLPSRLEQLDHRLERHAEHHDGRQEQELPAVGASDGRA